MVAVTDSFMAFNVQIKKINSSVATTVGACDNLGAVPLPQASA